MIHGADYPDVATSYDNLGVFYRSLTKYKEGNEHQKKLSTDINPDKDCVILHNTTRQRSVTKMHQDTDFR